MNFYVFAYSAVSITLLSLLNFLLIWSLHRQWWRIKGVRRAVWLFPASGIFVVVLWALASYIRFKLGITLFGLLASLYFVSSIALLLSLPFSGIALTVERFARWLFRNRKKDSAPPATQTEQSAATPNAIAISETAPETIDITRRSLITTGSVIIPGLAVGAGTYGVASSQNSVLFPNMEMFFKDLHPDLDGLRILHLTDVHIGYFITLDSVEEMLIEAEKQRPDIVLVSGDLSDDLQALPNALRMISQLRPRYGAFASLGNHEYHRGIRQVLNIFDAGPIPLLVENGETIKIKSTELFVSAADDPVAGGGGVTGNHERFLRRSVEEAVDGAPSEAFHLLMSHRPEGFNSAADLGLEMTVAGHKHGGAQMGWKGRSLMETWFGLGEYAWGHYEKNGGDSQLYTSAGIGHWFPFRLGVPREAPVYILRRGRNAVKKVGRV